MTKLNFEVKNNVAYLSVNRPEALNALSRQIVDEMDALLDRIAADEEIRVLVIGEPGNFAAGADIKGMVECDPEGAKAFAFNPTYNKLMHLPIPTIAAIDGYALGGGMELAITCDMRVATTRAVMGFPETGLGIMPGAGGTIRLPRLVGPAKANEMILLSVNVKGEEAQRIGLVNKVVEPDELMPTVVKWAEKLARKAPIALATAKETMVRGMELSSVEDGIDLEAEAWAGLFATEDQKEGMRAFVEKRKPNFCGK